MHRLNSVPRADRQVRLTDGHRLRHVHAELVQTVNVRNLGPHSHVADDASGLGGDDRLGLVFAIAVGNSPGVEARRGFSVDLEHQVVEGVVPRELVDGGNFAFLTDERVPVHESFVRLAVVIEGDDVAIPFAPGDIEAEAAAGVGLARDQVVVFAEPRAVIVVAVDGHVRAVRLDTAVAVVDNNDPDILRNVPEVLGIDRSN